MDNTLKPKSDYNLKDYYDNKEALAHEIAVKNGEAVPDNGYVDGNQNFTASSIDIFMGDTKVHSINDSELGSLPNELSDNAKANLRHEKKLR